MSEKDWGISDSESYWYNIRSGTVEHGAQSLALHRLGPFATQADAERAPEIIAERAKRIREEEERGDWP